MKKNIWVEALAKVGEVSHSTAQDVYHRMDRDTRIELHKNSTIKAAAMKLKEEESISNRSNSSSRSNPFNLRTSQWILIKIIIVLTICLGIALIQTIFENI